MKLYISLSMLKKVRNKELKSMQLVIVSQLVDTENFYK